MTHDYRIPKNNDTGKDTGPNGAKARINGITKNATPIAEAIMDARLNGNVSAYEGLIEVMAGIANNAEITIYRSMNYTVFFVPDTEKGYKFINIIEVIAKRNSRDIEIIKHEKLKTKCEDKKINFTQIDKEVIKYMLPVLEYSEIIMQDGPHGTEKEREFWEEVLKTL